jgi:O-glycosyl hydrolase
MIVPPKCLTHVFAAFGLWAFAVAAKAQNVAIDLTPEGRRQVIDGFGTCITGNLPQQTWWQQLYFDDLRASILRVDLTPHFRAPWSNHNYYSPWFLGSGNQPFSLNFEINASHQPRHYVGPPEWEWTVAGGTTYYNGPEGNRARTYTGPHDYGRSFGGFNAPIAVMGPNIDDNIARTLTLNHSMANSAAALVAAAKQRDPTLAHFKLVGSLWSPAPWLKVSSGNVTSTAYGQWPFARPGTPMPHVSTSGNFVGGRLDVSGVPLAVFDDSVLPADVPGGPNASAPRGPTTALTQFARSTAAYVRAFQNHVGARFYAISIQNELNFETFYHSCTYPLSSQYIAAVKAVRAEFDKYDDLRDIKIKGPEDLLQGNDYGLWQFGGGANTVHKNLQYLVNIAADPAAAAAVDFFCIHGYAADGASSSGTDPVAWERWANGWSSSPAAGIPANVPGFTAYQKKSWMTETSGENAAWLWPTSGFPNDGGWSIALKIHQALTTGQQSAWIYWQFAEGNNVTPSTLTGSNLGALSPKYVAMKHYARYIRPGAVRVEATVTGANASDIQASAFLHDDTGSLVIVLVNRAAAARNVTLAAPAAVAAFDRYTSSNNSYWQASTATVVGGQVAFTLPAYSVATLVSSGPPPPPPPMPPRVNAGGPAAGEFAADTGFSGGTPFQNTTGTIDTSGVSAPAPIAVYQWERFGNTTYRYTGLEPHSYHRLRLHFAENFWTAPGQRSFDVRINGVTRLAAFDVFAAAGARHRAHVRELAVQADAQGELTVEFVTLVNNALINGLERLAASADTPYLYWRDTTFAPAAVAAGDGDPLATPAGDGVANLIKWGLGIQNPTTPALPAQLPQVGVDPHGRLTLSFHRARAEATYTVEVADTPGAWQTLVVNPGAVGALVTATDTLAAPGAPRRFIRLRVSW